MIHREDARSAELRHHGAEVVIDPADRRDFGGRSVTGRPAVSAAAAYAAGGVRARIEAALRGAGKDFDALTPADLAGGLASY